MRLLVQKTYNEANVSINNEIYNKIPKGLVVFVGFTDGDDEAKINWMVNKVTKLRIFEDENNIMNKSVIDIGGEILSISQFTLYADATEGNRPSYIKAMKSEEATKLYDLFNEKLNQIIPTKSGVFGADMKINLINDGPTTIWIEK